MRVLASLIALLVFVATFGTPSSAQQLMALRAEWSDLQTWATDIGNTREREVGLGLHLSGPSGATLLAFIARINTRAPNAAPADVVAQIATGAMTNPNVVRTPTLTFVIDPGGEKASRLELTHLLMTDDSTGGTVQNGIAVFPASDFLRLAGAESLSANVFGFDADLRSDQIRAIKDFAERLNLRK